MPQQYSNTILLLQYNGQQFTLKVNLVIFNIQSKLNKVCNQKQLGKHCNCIIFDIYSCLLYSSLSLGLAEVAGVSLFYDRLTINFLSTHSEVAPHWTIMAAV